MGFLCVFFVTREILLQAEPLPLAAPSIVLREAEEIQHGFSREKFVKFRKGGQSLVEIVLCGLAKRVPFIDI